jgi:hypothetical protein
VGIVVELGEGLEITLDAEAAADLGRALRAADAGETPGDAASVAIQIQEALAGHTPPRLRWTEKEEVSVLAVLNTRQGLAGQHPCLRKLHNALLGRD